MDEWDIIEYVFELARWFLMFVTAVLLVLLGADFAGLNVGTPRTLFMVAIFVASLMCLLALKDYSELKAAAEVEDIQPEVKPEKVRTDPQVEPEPLGKSHIQDATYRLLSQFAALLAGIVMIRIVGFRQEAILPAVLAGIFVLMPHAWWESRRMKRLFIGKGVRLETRGVTIGKYIVLVVALAFVLYFAGIAFFPDQFLREP